VMGAGVASESESESESDSERETGLGVVSLTPAARRVCLISSRKVS